MLNVSEIFGPTIQGEGTAAGRHCMFLRLANCNLACKWCDTAFTWAFTPAKAAKTNSGVLYDKTEQVKAMTTEQVVSALRKEWDIQFRPTLVVVSGGEPLLQANSLVSVARVLNYEYGNDIHIETAGTLTPPTTLDMYVQQYNVSPKLAHSGNSLIRRYLPYVLKWFAQSPKAQFKFVVKEINDLEEVDDIVQSCGIRTERVAIMPEGVFPHEQIDRGRDLVPHVLERGYNLTLRMHTLLWRDKRGV